MLVVVIVDCRGGWTENVLRDALFSLLGTNQNVLWDTNDFNIDSLMGTKKMSTVFRNSCLSQSGVIVDAKVSDRQRRCCAPCRNVIGYKSSLLPMCFLVLTFYLVGCYSRWELPPSDNDSVLFGTCSQVQLSIYVSCVFPQSGFPLHSGFAEDFRHERSGFFCHIWSSSDLYNNSGTPTASSAQCGGYCLSALQKRPYGNRKCPSRRTILRYGCLQYYLNVQKA